jgi:hypothetical protein
MSSTNRGGQRIEGDFYATPRWCVDAIVPHLPPLSGKRILEPSAGRGAIVKALLAHGADPRSTVAVEISAERARVCATFSLAVVENDFEAFSNGCHGRTGGPRFDLVVMNPPYCDAEEHVRRAISLLATGGVCAALLRLPFVLCGQGRRAFRRAHPCDVFPLDARPSFTAEILEWATDADLLGMAEEKDQRFHVDGDGRRGALREPETIANVRKRLRGSDSADYAWALYGDGRGGRYQVLEGR